MATQAETVSQLQAVKALQAKTAGEIASLQAQIAALNSDKAVATGTIANLTTQRDALVAEKAALVLSNQALAAQVAALQAQLAAIPPATNGDSTPEMVAAAAEVLAGAQANDALIADITNPPPPADPGDVLAVRLGKSYAEYSHPAGVGFPDVYLRPVIATPEGSYRHFTNEGLVGLWQGNEVAADYPDYKVLVGGVWVSVDANNLPAIGTPKWNLKSGDFSSSIGQAYGTPDLPLDAPDPDHINSGVGVFQLELENMSDNAFSGDPILLSLPDPRAYEWLFNQGIPATQVGLPIGIARGQGRWSNAGLVLFTGGLAGTASTPTAKIPHGGPILPTTHKPTNICLTSGNEFTLITCIEKATGKGKLAMFANWGGKRLQEASGLGSFYHDWPEPYPGLSNPAIYCGFKLLGFVDLGINFPSDVSAVASKGSDRVNAADGNAGTLGDKDLSLQATRDEFRTGNNSTYISSWGFAVVISRTENKAVWVDLSAIFAGYRDQYTTTQALFDATLPKNKGGNWWTEFGTGDTDWPPTFVGKPEWTPQVAMTVSVQEPTAVLCHEGNDGAVIITSEDGTGHFFKGVPASSSPVQANGTITLGRNVTCLFRDKFGDGRTSGFFAISRGDRRIDLVNGWGAGAAIAKTLRDARMVDPVAGECYDTHGINVGGFDVCDREGRQILGYRYTDLTMVNFGNQVFPIQGGADWECDGILPTPFGKPIGISGTNVN